MKTIIDTIPHSKQRYETPGDYWEEGGVQQIVVSELGDEKMDFLVKLHEFIEQNLCRFRGIKETDIKLFDEEFELNRKKGNTDEPGFDSKSPYVREHTIATGIEFLVAAELGVDIKEYDKKINSLRQ